MQLDKSLALGHIPSGLFIVVVKDSATKLVDGFLASWIQQISFTPPMLSMAMKPGRPAYDLISRGCIFTVNIVGDHEKSYLKHFWKGYDPNQNPFNELSLSETETGGVLLTQAKSSLECRLSQKVSPGDHDIILAEVLSSYVHSEEAKSMVHIRKTGASY
jgi:flavin reductase (DIM6/NTAB) family NADH-FMN oxidoreductase RutF